MPCNWTEKPWPDVIEKMSSVRDAIGWIVPRHHAEYHHDALSVWEWLLQHATLRQVLNFSDAAHTVQTAAEAAVRQEWQAEREVEIQWPAMLPQGSFTHKELVVTELTSASELEDEGSRLSHCISDYAHDCVVGRSRILSVRNIDGDSLSSVEVWREADPKTRQVRLRIAQHRTYRNRAPSAACAEAVDVFMRAAHAGHIAVNMEWPRGVLPWDQRHMELANRVRNAVCNELFRRWPDLRSVVQPVDNSIDHH
jgi:hypothetical protein